jgi:hypothetical protein
MEADFNYFRRRAREERESAMRAAHPAARQAHIELADRYEELASAIAEREVELFSRVAG